MKTLYLAWQAAQPGPTGGPASRAWYPIGRLDSLPELQRFRFAYTQGAERARKEAGFAPLEAFPKWERLYEDDELFPLWRTLAYTGIRWGEAVGLSASSLDLVRRRR